MGSYILGALLAFVVTYGAMLGITKNHLIFFSGEALLVVLGGTMAAALLTFPIGKVFKLLRIIFIVFRKEIDTGPHIVKEIVNLARETRGQRNALSDAMAQIKNDFLRDGVELITQKIDEERLELILKDRIRVKQEMDESNANMLRTLGKYPPAFGLLATVISLVALLEGMGSGAAGPASLGPSMAAGLVGTMYGIILANFFFTPMSENLLLKSSLDLRNRQITMVGILLLQANESPRVIQESLNSMLEIGARVNLLGTVDREAA